MACASDCLLKQSCTSIDVPDLRIDPTTLTVPTEVAPDSIVTITGTVTNNELWVPPLPNVSQVRVCVYDLATKLCVGNTDLMYVLKSVLGIGGRQDFSVSFPMPNNNITVQIVPLDLTLPYGYLAACGVPEKRTIVKSIIPGMPWKCNPATSYCYQDPTGTYSDEPTCCAAECNNCGVIGTTACDTSTNMNLYGLCVPKPVVALGAVVLLLSIMKG